MIISIWRYSHLVLAVSSFLLLTLASVTGIALAFDPVLQKVKEYKVAGRDELGLAEVIPVIRSRFKDVQALSMDDHGFAVLDWTDTAGTAVKSYVDPRTAAVLGPVREQSQFFQWVTSLHRSLFLHETGRFLVGLAAFLLILITLSGIILVIQRQQRITRFFGRVERDHFAQYYHVIFGRVMLFPILFMALTGAYLSITRFDLVHTETPRAEVPEELPDSPELPLDSMAFFRETMLGSVQKLEFPFSEFPEDYYTVTLNDGQVAINQFTGEKISEVSYSIATQLSAFSLRWHTGRSGIVWALIMAISSGYVLFFIYSGFVITFRRRANRAINRFKAEDSRIVILVGSENGSTMRFAGSVYNQLVAGGEKVFMTDLDNYRLFPLMEQLIVMTSTYGLGDPPSNGHRFAARLAKYPQAHAVRYSIVAFGSRTYADFCGFGLHVDELLHKSGWAHHSTEVFTVNDRSPQDFSNWAKAWSEQAGLPVSLTPELIPDNSANLHEFPVLTRSTLSSQDDSFLISFGLPGKMRVRSGDLLAIYPAGDHRERLYSIGMVEKRIQLSVKLHASGLGSSFLHSLNAGSVCRGRVVKNQHFHFPSRASSVIMVSNGTGIAPFLGMIDENRKRVRTTLYCGFRWDASFEPYKTQLDAALRDGRLAAMQLALSRESDKKYVTHYLLNDRVEIARVLGQGATLMICGSLAMQRDVMEALNVICQDAVGLGVDELVKKGKILTDCY